ncbi:hypothetical protein ACOSP7_017096 [Xanthoceras sorbifolium]
MNQGSLSPRPASKLRENFHDFKQKKASSLLCCSSAQAHLFSSPLLLKASLTSAIVSTLLPCRRNTSSVAGRCHRQNFSRISRNPEKILLILETHKNPAFTKSCGILLRV